LLKYGTDKPDLRIPIEIKDLTSCFKDHAFKAFSNKTVRAFSVPEAFDQPRSWFDNLQEEAKKLGAPGLAYVKVSETHEYTGPIAKFLDPETQKVLSTSFDTQEKIFFEEGEGTPLTEEQKTVEGFEATVKAHEVLQKGKPFGVKTVIFFSADANETKAAKVLGAMRVKIAEQLNLIETGVFKFAWIVDYPMFEMNEETKDIEFSHNPFSMPQGGLEALEKQDPLTIFAYQYDLVCNGYEIASGAIRNHIPEIMYKAFALAGHPKEVVDTEFAGMINAFRYGAPPHGGIAPGIDRIIMLLANESSIREVIAFPMAQNGRDLLMNAPAPVSERQLRDVHLSIRKPVPKV
jgi:aspartyl-tRNA synthetase